MSIRARLTLAMLLGLLLGVSLSVAHGVLAEREPPGSAALPWGDARLLAEVIQRVRDNYVDAVEDHKLMQNAIRGMVEALETPPASRSPADSRAWKSSTAAPMLGSGLKWRRARRAS